MQESRKKCLDIELLIWELSRKKEKVIFFPFLPWASLTVHVGSQAQGIKQRYPIWAWPLIRI